MPHRVVGGPPRAPAITAPAPSPAPSPDHAGAPGTSPGRATLYVVLAACCFGAITILTAIAAAGGSALFNTMAWRYTLGAALLVAMSGARVLRVPRGRAARLLVVGGGGQALVSFLGLVPLTRYHVPAATLGFLFYTFPAWVALLAAIRGTERVDARRAAALLLSLAGIVLLVGDPRASSLSPIGVGIALLAAVVYAVYIPVLNQLRGELPPAVASAYVAAGAGVIYLASAATAGVLTTAVTSTAWAAIGALAVFSLAVGFSLFLRGLRVLGPVRAAIVSTAEPFFTAGLAAVALAQPLTIRTGAGGALIAAAVVLLQRRGA